MKKISTLLAAAAMVLAANAQSLTVCDGTDWSSMFPVYGMYVDSEGSTSQMIYPADMLTDLRVWGNGHTSACRPTAAAGAELTARQA